MPDTVPPSPWNVTDPFRPSATQNGPDLPPGELSTFLSQVTPPGAPALHVALWGVRAGVELYPLPITKPSHRGGPDWLRGELKWMNFRGIPLRNVEIDELVEWLARGPSRTDGLPGYAPHLWAGPPHRTTTQRRPAWVRRIAAAVAFDLGDYALVEVSAKVLGLTDHEMWTKDARVTDGTARKAREYRRFGRALLARLGAWPWADVERGNLPATWRTDAAFLEPLRAWHENACDELEQQLARSRWAWDAGSSLYLGWRDADGVVHRGDRLKLPLEGVPPTPREPLDEATRLERQKQLGWSPEAAEDGVRVAKAMSAAQDARVDAFERARRDRRPV